MVRLLGEIRRTVLAAHPHAFGHGDETGLLIRHTVDGHEAFKAHAHMAIGAAPVPFVVCARPAVRRAKYRRGHTDALFDLKGLPFKIDGHLPVRRRGHFDKHARSPQAEAVSGVWAAGLSPNLSRLMLLMSINGDCPRTISAMSLPVIRESPMPLPSWPVATKRPLIWVGDIMGLASGVQGRRPA